MATEPIQSGPYPVPGDAPDGPAQMLAIVAWAAGRLVMRFASTAARDAALPSPADGMVCYVAADKSIYARIDGAWVVLWRASTSPMVQRGIANVATGGITAGGAGAAATVTFPAPFPGTPTVVIQMARATSYFLIAGVGGENANGFTLTPRNLGSSTTPAGQTVGFPWVAVY